MTENKIKKIEDIERIKTCPECRKGTCKLKMFYVLPTTGKVSLSYGHCDRPFCTGKGFLMFTNIIIKKLALGE